MAPRVSKDREPNAWRATQMIKVAQDADVGGDVGLFSALMAIADRIGALTAEIAGLRDDLRLMPFTVRGSGRPVSATQGAFQDKDGSLVRQATASQQNGVQGLGPA